MSTVKIDEGWSWAVPVGGFIANFIVGGLAKSFGIIMRSTQELYDSAAAPLTLAGGLIYTFMYCVSLVGILLSEKYGCRTIINIGAVGCVISFFGAFLAPNVIVWVIAVGVGVGVSLGFIYSLIFVMIGRCFRKRVGIAMGFSVAGVSVGQMAFPALITVIIDKYSARGSFLIGAGIVSHFFVTAALMPRYITEDCKYEKPKENKIGNGDIEKIPLQTIKGDEKINNNTPVAKGKKQKSFKKIHVVMLVLFVVAKVFGDLGDVGIAFALPPYGEKALNLNNQNISQAIAVAGGVDLVSRVFIGIISDQTWCRHSLVLNVAWLIESFTCFFFVWFPYVTSYYVFYGIFGLCSGTAITLMTVVLTDLVGQINMPFGFAIMMLTIGLVIAPGQFLVGYLADVYNSYAVSLKFLGYNMFLAFFVMCLEYPIKKIFFNTTSPTADLDIIQSVPAQDNANGPKIDENVKFIIIDPSKDPRSRLSSISTLSHIDVKEIFA